jgi:hypothetical protein
LDPTFTGSDPSEEDGFLRAIKKMQHDFLQAEYSHQSHVARFYSILKNP